MGIDSIAIKTFNSSGSQSVCRANEADETKLIQSEFLTKCTTEYINGSGTSFISGNVDLIDEPTTEVFTLPSDIDAISEITLQMSLDASGTNISSTFILDLIKKIEIKVGNLVVQTILPGDIYARNLTESGYVVNANTYQNLDGSGFLYTKGDHIDFSLSIPFTGRSSSLSRAFLQAGAITNSLTMKVYYNSIGSSPPTTRLATTFPGSIKTGICVLSHSMTSTEKNFIAKNIINRTVNTSQSLVTSVSNFGSSDPRPPPVIIDLNSININVSHILITLSKSLFKSSGAPLNNADGKGTSWSASTRSVSATSDIGVCVGWLKSAELILGNDRTGAIPGSCLAANKLEFFKLTSIPSEDIYVIKLASSAFSTAGVPFSRLNNKKLILNFANDFFFFSYEGGSEKGLSNINVTCCGTQVQSTVGGTISFSA